MAGIERRMMGMGELRVAPKDDGKRRRSRAMPRCSISLSVDMWGFREQVAPGAFADTLAAGDDVRALFNHDPNIILGRTKSGTLRLAEDDTGLYVEIDPPDTEQARALVAGIERGDVDQMSFGFAVIMDKWSIDANEQYVRTLEQVKLYDVSPVVYPAYPDTSVSVRGANAWFGEIPEIPAELRQAAGSAAEGDQVRAHLATLRRRLDIASVE